MEIRLQKFNFCALFVSQLDPVLMYKIFLYFFLMFYSLQITSLWEFSFQPSHRPTDRTWLSSCKLIFLKTGIPLKTVQVPSYLCDKYSLLCSYRCWTKYLLYFASNSKLSSTNECFLYCFLGLEKIQLWSNLSSQV